MSECGPSQHQSLTMELVPLLLSFTFQALVAAAACGSCLLNPGQARQEGESVTHGKERQERKTERVWGVNERTSTRNLSPSRLQKFNIAEKVRKHAFSLMAGICGVLMMAPKESASRK